MFVGREKHERLNIDAMTQGVKWRRSDIFIKKLLFGVR